jgi:hypothetical protein
MKIPVWFKPAAWGAVVGAIALSLVGFTQLGWMTSGTADRMALTRSENAVIAALVPFCLDKARMDPDPALVAKLKAEQSSYSRSDVVSKAGWATFAGDRNPHSGVARACSDQLYETKAG